MTIEQKLFESGGKRPWVIEQDKVEHWAFGFVLTLFALIHPIFIFTGYGFTILKECDDWKNGKFDAKDMLAGFIGAGMALVMLAFIGVFSWGMIF